VKHLLRWLPSPRATSRLAWGLALLASHSWCGLQAMALTNAANYPDKPIKIIVPYTPGGGTDTKALAVTEAHL
jgi:tripartite-type tricarboxylate transporter receptor subunit TctC